MVSAGRSRHPELRAGLRALPLLRDGAAAPLRRARAHERKALRRHVAPAHARGAGSHAHGQGGVLRRVRRGAGGRLHSRARRRRLPGDGADRLQRDDRRRRGDLECGRGAGRQRGGHRLRRRGRERRAGRASGRRHDHRGGRREGLGARLRAEARRDAHGERAHRVAPWSACTRITGGGAHFAFEAYGGGATTRMAVDMLRKRGTAVIVGIAPIGDVVTHRAARHHAHGEDDPRLLLRLRAAPPGHAAHRGLARARAPRDRRAGDAPLRARRHQPRIRGPGDRTRSAAA